MGLPLFVYGTLMLPAIRTRFVARDIPVIPAELPGWRRIQLVDRDYPAIIPQADSIVPGLLLTDLATTEHRRIDRYEGREYVRRIVTVHTAKGRRRAWVYVPRKGVETTEKEWITPL